MQKRYYWLKLKKDFFNSIRIRKLRSIAGGDTFTIIYLKMLLHTIDTDGVIQYQGIEKSIAEEMALILGEDAENVGLCLNYLCTVGLAEAMGDEIFLPEAAENTGSEGASAERMRNLRGRRVSHCDISVTPALQIGDGEIEKEKEIDKRKNNISPIPLEDGSDWYISDEQLEGYKNAYPSINVEGELSKMRAWCLSNPTKRKTRRGITKFVNNWLSRATEKPSNAPVKKQRTNIPDYMLNEYTEEETASQEDIDELAEMIKRMK